MVSEKISILPLGVGSGWADGIVAETPEAAAVVGLLRDIQRAQRPEFVEAGGGEIQRREAGARRLVEIFQPLAHACGLR